MAGSVTLKWRSDFFAATSTVERGTTSGGPYTPVSDDLNFLKGTYKDTAATPGTTYYYVVVCHNPAGAGSPSNEVSVAVAASGPGPVNNASQPAGPPRGTWLKVPSPAAAPVTAQLPPGYTATKAWDLVTRAKVAVKVSGNTATYAVADDPVCLQVVPASSDSH
jgi:hypothetical protein